MVRLPPARSNSARSTRNSLACTVDEIADLVEQMVPPCANSKRPSRLFNAGERALLVAEKLAFDQVVGTAQLTLMNDALARALPMITRATSSLPVPLSPWMSTVACVGTCTDERRSRSWQALPKVRRQPRPRPRGW